MFNDTPIVNIKNAKLSSAGTFNGNFGSDGTSLGFNASSLGVTGDRFALSYASTDNKTGKTTVQGIDSTNLNIDLAGKKGANFGFNSSGGQSNFNFSMPEVSATASNLNYTRSEYINVNANPLSSNQVSFNNFSATTSLNGSFGNVLSDRTPQFASTTGANFLTKTASRPNQNNSSIFEINANDLKIHSDTATFNSRTNDATGGSTLSNITANNVNLNTSINFKQSTGNTPTNSSMDLSIAPINLSASSASGTMSNNPSEFAKSKDPSIIPTTSSFNTGVLTANISGVNLSKNGSKGSMSIDNLGLNVSNVNFVQKDKDGKIINQIDNLNNFKAEASGIQGQGSFDVHQLQVANINTTIDHVNNIKFGDISANDVKNVSLSLNNVNASNINNNGFASFGAQNANFNIESTGANGSIKNLKNLNASLENLTATGLSSNSSKFSMESVGVGKANVSLQNLDSLNIGNNSLSNLKNLNASLGNVSATGLSSNGSNFSMASAGVGSANISLENLGSANFGGRSVSNLKNLNTSLGNVSASGLSSTDAGFKLDSAGVGSASVTLDSLASANFGENNRLSNLKNLNASLGNVSVTKFSSNGSNLSMANAEVGSANFTLANLDSLNVGNNRLSNLKNLNASLGKVLANGLSSTDAEFKLDSAGVGSAIVTLDSLGSANFGDNNRLSNLKNLNASLGNVSAAVISSKNSNFSMTSAGVGSAKISLENLSSANFGENNRLYGLKNLNASLGNVLATGLSSNGSNFSMDSAGVGSVNLSLENLGSANFGENNRISNLKNLNASLGNVSASGLSSNGSNFSIASAGVGSANLSLASLGNLKVGENNISNLKGLNASLKDVSLNDLASTDAGFALKSAGVGSSKLSLTSVENINFGENRISDLRGLNVNVSNTKLENLTSSQNGFDLGNAKISEASIKVSKLKGLAIGENNITNLTSLDAGLSDLNVSGLSSGDNFSLDKVTLRKASANLENVDSLKIAGNQVSGLSGLKLVAGGVTLSGISSQNGFNLNSADVGGVSVNLDKLSSLSNETTKLSNLEGVNAGIYGLKATGLSTSNGFEMDSVNFRKTNLNIKNLENLSSGDLSVNELKNLSFTADGNSMSKKYYPEGSSINDVNFRIGSLKGLTSGNTSVNELNGFTINASNIELPKISNNSSNTGSVENITMNLDSVANLKSGDSGVTNLKGLNVSINDINTKNISFPNGLELGSVNVRNTFVELKKVDKIYSGADEINDIKGVHLGISGIAVSDLSTKDALQIGGAKIKDVNLSINSTGNSKNVTNLKNLEIDLNNLELKDLKSSDAGFTLASAGVGSTNAKVASVDSIAFGNNNISNLKGLDVSLGNLTATGLSSTNAGLTLASAGVGSASAKLSSIDSANIAGNNISNLKGLDLSINDITAKDISSTNAGFTLASAGVGSASAKLSSIESTNIAGNNISNLKGFDVSLGNLTATGLSSTNAGLTLASAGVGSASAKLSSIDSANIAGNNISNLKGLDVSINEITAKDLSSTNAGLTLASAGVGSASAKLSSIDSANIAGNNISNLKGLDLSINDITAKDLSSTNAGLTLASAGVGSASAKLSSIESANIAGNNISNLKGLDVSINEITATGLSSTNAGLTLASAGVGSASAKLSSIESANIAGNNISNLKGLDVSLGNLTATGLSSTDAGLTLASAGVVVLVLNFQVLKVETLLVTIFQT